MSESLQGTHGFQSSWRGGKVPLNSEIAIVRVNGGTTKIGFAVSHTGETYPDVAPAITTDRQVLGVVNAVQNLTTVLKGRAQAPVVVADPNWDMDDVIKDNNEVEVYKLGCGAVMAMLLENKAGPVAMVKGDYIAIGADDAGKVRKYLYSDTSEATDSMVEVIGRCYEAIAGDTTNDLVVLVELNV